MARKKSLHLQKFEILIVGNGQWLPPAWSGIISNSIGAMVHGIKNTNHPNDGLQFSISHF